MSPSINPDSSITPNEIAPKPKSKPRLDFNLSPAKISVILTCLAFVAIGATVALILAGRPKTTPEVEIPNNDQTGNQSENQNQDQTKPPVANIPDESHLTVQLTDFHRPNNLIFSGNEYEYSTKEYTKLSVSNLKNKDLENRINSIMSNYHDVRGFNIYVRANFGNVLSLQGNMQDGSTESHNIRLDTGGEIQFEDIFTVGTSITELVVDAYRYSYLYKLCQENDPHGLCHGGVGDVDPGPNFEEDLMKVANLYKDNGISRFDFSGHIVSFEINGLTTFIEFAPIHEHIAIYKRFLTNGDNIYEKDLHLVENFVFSNKFAIESLYTNYKFGLIRPNLFVFVNLQECSIGTSEDCDVVRTETNRLVERAEDFAAARPDSYYFFYLPYDEPKHYEFLPVIAATSQNQLLDIVARSARHYPSGSTSITPADLGFDDNRVHIISLD